MVFVKTKLLFGGQASGNRAFSRLKRSEVYARTINIDVSVPALVARGPANAHNTAGVSGVYALVFTVYRVCYLAKVFFAIITSVMIDMINLIRGSLPIEHDPHNPMRKVVSTVYGTLAVAFKVCGERLFARPAAIPLRTHAGVVFPKQLSGLALVGKPLVQVRGGWYFCKSHPLHLHDRLEFSKMQWSPSSPLRRKGSLPLPCGGVGGVPLPAADAVTHRS